MFLQFNFNLSNASDMISEKEVKNAMQLCRIKADNENEIATISKRLTYVMKMINLLNDIDCTDIEPLASVCEQKAFSRDDVVTSPDLSSKLFSNAPGDEGKFAAEIKCFIVPKVIE